MIDHPTPPFVKFFHTTNPMKSPTIVQCSAPTQIGYDEFPLIGFDEHGDAIVDEGTNGWLELKLYTMCEDKTACYGFMLDGVWYEFARSIRFA
jgi:hypothetical protein